MHVGHWAYSASLSRPTYTSVTDVNARRWWPWILRNTKALWSKIHYARFITFYTRQSNNV